MFHFKRKSSTWQSTGSPLGSPKKLYSTWQSKKAVFQHCLRAFLLHFSYFPALPYFSFCARSYCIPAPPHAENYTLCVHLNCVALLSQHIRLCAFLLCSSTVGVHFYYVQAHSAAHSALSATVLRHCVRAFLLYSSTFLVAFTHVCMC